MIQIGNAGKSRRPGGRPKKGEGDAVARETIRSIMRMTEEKRRPPTRRELADDLGRSVSAVIEHLEVLRKRGHVDFEIGAVRSLIVTTNGERFAAEDASDMEPTPTTLETAK